jgi:C4-type Zn-finger protein
VAKKQTFQDKLKVKTEATHCPVCDAELQYVRHVKAVKTDGGAWKFQSRNTKVCKCNEKEIYV